MAAPAQQKLEEILTPEDLDTLNTILEGEYDEEYNDFYKHLPEEFLTLYNTLKTKYGIGPNATLTNDYFNSKPLLSLYLDNFGEYIIDDFLTIADFLLKEGANINQVYQSLNEEGEIENTDTLTSSIENANMGVPSIQKVKWCLDHGADASRALPKVIEKYNSDMDFFEGIPPYKIEELLRFYKVFFSHPQVKRVPGYKELVSTMEPSFNEAVSRVKNYMNRRTEEVSQTAKRPGRRNRYFARKGIPRLKAALNIPSITQNNLKKPVTSLRNYKRYEQVLKGAPRIGRMERNRMLSYLRKPTFKVAPTEVGLKHVNSSLFQGGRKTRKQRKQKRGTRRRN